jgi:TetR/AcrR family transcriptional regulator, cholesterol catabolism regulator
MKEIRNPLSLTAPTEPDRLADIYRAAARIICEKGYDATSMNDIAEAVGLTKAGLYHHISGKRDLLFRIMNFGLDALEEEVIIPALAAEDAEERLRTIITKHVQLITSRSTPQGNNPVSIVVDEVTGLTPSQRRKTDQRKRVYVDLIHETLVRLREEGKLSDVDLTAAAYSLLGMILWLSRWYNPAGRLTPQQVSEEVTKIATAGLLNPRRDEVGVEQPIQTGNSERTPLTGRSRKKGLAPKITEHV